MKTAEEKRASAAYIVKHGRIRPSHAVSNDAALEAAMVTVIAESGWDDLSLNKVSKAAGLTNGAVHARFADKGALGAHIWERQLRAPLIEALDAVITAGLAADASSPAIAAQTLAQFAAAMDAFIRPAAKVRAALDLVMGSRFDPQQRAAIFDPMAAWLRDRCQPPSALPDPARAAQATAIAIWALGLVVFSNRPWVNAMDPAPAIARIHDALAHPAAAQPLPETKANYLRAAPFDTGDPRVDMILLSALESIGTVGYQRTHVALTTQAAGVSESFAFTRYPTKLDLFIAVTEAGYEQAYEDIVAFRESVAAGQGAGAAEAVTWREYLSPDVSGRRTVGIEGDRLSWYNTRMRDTAFAADTAVLDGLLAALPEATRPEMTGHLHLDFASGHGLPIIGELLPDSWQLPFDVVTTPHTASDPLPA
jgi:AcrR family transcriptional regulator